MRELLLGLWQDERGCVVATEWVLVATILVLGAVTGLVVQQSTLAQANDVPAVLTWLVPR